MDSFNKFRDVKAEKANAISRYRRVKRITTLFRFVEVFVFMIILARISSNQFVFFSFGEYFKAISGTLISPRFVFVIGNAIVVVLFFISGGFSAKNEEKRGDFYDEYVEKCRKINMSTYKKEEKVKPCENSVCNDEKKTQRRISVGFSAKNGEKKKAFPDEYVEKCRKINRQTHIKEEKIRARENSVCFDEKKTQSSISVGFSAKNGEKTGKKMTRSCSEANIERAVVRGQELRRSVTEKCRKSVDEDMSGEEFRKTVEAFIARQQRCLREEEEDSI